MTDPRDQGPVPPVSYPRTIAGMMCGVAVGLATGFAAGLSVDRTRPRSLWEVHPEFRTELEPKFQRYLRADPAERRRWRTGRLPVPGGGSVPIEEFYGLNGADYFLIPLDRVDGPRARRWWQHGDDWEILNYKPGYALAILDPMFAARLLDDPPDPWPPGPLAD